jgi:hypothetical protein
MIDFYDFNNSELWNNCSDFHKKTLLCPNIFGHVLLENKSNIKNLNLIENVIETGTFEGKTSIFFSLLFKNVYTIELFEKLNPYSGLNHEFLYESIKNKYKNINFYFGNSGEVLKNILKENSETQFLIILDAHTYNYSPMIDELDSIHKFSKRNDHIIIIDDCKFLGSNGYPTIEELSNKIYEINKNYKIVETNHGNSIFLIYPK